ncbi:MMPL family transporter [Dermatobacter hominis]|uniref:MMPL family transporter n=1 Tax=Dermatobacter hominis TaxID=2884263 RepID=UPI001D10810C|nr:MMPL family transporter [Dermatobacter hominis]UDY36833.1 MMPL family transporter [Dermatobacter hominis]
MFGRLGGWCCRRRGRVLVIWLLVFVVGGALSGALGNSFKSEFNLPDVESKHGMDILEDDFGGEGAGTSGTIVFESASGFDDATRTQLNAFLDQVAEVRDTTVQSPFAPGGERQISVLDGAEGRIAFAQIEVPGELEQESAQEYAEEVQALAPDVDGVRIEYGGQMFSEFEPPESELLGLAFAIVILIVAFGSVLAMGLPIGVALGGIGVGSILLTILSNVITMPDFATTLGVMIGLGVGIDYALFIVTRYREQLHLGHSVEESVAIAIDTSGRAVTFAGLTVVISLLGMLLMGVSFVQGLGIGAATVVAVTMVASLTLLPALLGFAGERVDRTRWRGLIAAGLIALALLGLGLKIQPLAAGAFLVAIVVLVLGFFWSPLKREVPRREPKPLRDTTSYRWSRIVQRHPWSMALGATAFLVVLMIPTFAMRLGFPDEGNDPAGTTTREAYDLLAEGFGPGYNGPLMLVATLPDGTTPEALQAITTAVQETPGVAFASPAIPNDEQDPTAALWRVIPTTAPQDEATTELVHHLRDDVLPAAEDGSGVDVLVSGFVAVTVDFTAFVSERLFLFFGAVLTLSFILLMVVFRSLLVPVKAVIMNLLSIGAAYGVLVAVFQWGWAKDLFGIEPAPIEPFMPMMLFAIVFGLSMDYEVFLLSRIREEWVRTGDSHASVADGLAATARVITAAAAIMVFVFGSFLGESVRTIKLFGFGLALAVLLDATVVRMLLVPATMELLGDRNWWLPKWLDRILPHVNVEGTLEHSNPGEDDTPDDTPDEDRELEPVG